MTWVAVCGKEGCFELYDRRNAGHRFCSDVCRAAQWKAENDYRAHRPSRENGGQRRTNAPGGLQVSFLKAVEAVASELYADRRYVERVLAGVLSDRQRARWEAER